MNQAEKTRLVWLLGNGFNFAVNSFLSDDSISDDIKKIIRLWDTFTKLFKDIRSKLGCSNDEEAIQYIYTGIDIIKSIKPWAKIHTTNNFLDCVKLIETFIRDNIDQALYNIILDFIKSECNGIYKKLVSYLYENDPNIWNILDEANSVFFTTNYDGIGEMILAYDPHGEQHKIKYPDFFSYETCLSKEYGKFVCFNSSMEASNFLLHLHGSYKFFEYKSQLIKLAHQGCEELLKVFKNGEIKILQEYAPIIVFNAPNLKRSIITRNVILNFYFQLFRRELAGYNNVLIIWGQSLKNDPHLADVILTNFDSLYKIIVIVPNPNQVIDILRERDHNKVMQNSSKIIQISKERYSDFSKLSELLQFILDQI